MVKTMKTWKTVETSSETPERTAGQYAAQCERCSNWRKIDSQKEYEELGSRLLHEPFYCHRKPGFTCDTVDDIVVNAERVWTFDKPGLPKTPDDFKRISILRKNLSRTDVYYITPTENRLRSIEEVKAYLAANPQYKASVDDFTFTTPVVVPDSVTNSATTSGRDLMITEGSTSGNLKESEEEAES